MAKIIDGKAISKAIKDEVKQQVEEWKQQGITVTLAVIQVGSNQASTVYVNNKKKACEYTGIRSFSYELPEETTQEELLSLVRELNDREDVNGILVQLPLPAHMDEDEVIRTEKGCGRLSSPERWRVMHRPAGVCILHPCGDYRAAQKIRR